MRYEARRGKRRLVSRRQSERRMSQCWSSDAALTRTGAIRRKYGRVRGCRRVAAGLYVTGGESGVKECMDHDELPDVVNSFQVRKVWVVVVVVVVVSEEFLFSNLFWLALVSSLCVLIHVNAARRGEAKARDQARPGQVRSGRVVSNCLGSASVSKFQSLLVSRGGLAGCTDGSLLQPPAASCRAPIGQCSGGHRERRRLNERTVMATVRCING
ncbi:hypothetical protein HDV57DRAFT_274827 [Trichoderma longibrachiatum]